ncbi:MAG: cytochrome P450 [bacterium]
MPATAVLPDGPSAPPVVQTAELTARPVDFVERCRDRFGGTFSVRLSRIGPMVFFSDPASIKQVFASDRENTITQGRNVVLEPILGTKSLLVQEGAEHLARRKLMLPPFHGERMRAYEQSIERATAEEISNWPTGETVLSHPAMQRITLEVIMSAVFGVSDERHDSLRAGLNRVLSSTRSPFAFGLTFSLLRKIPPYSSMLKSLRETDRLIAAEISDRRADPSTEEREDILSMLVSARDEDGQGLDDIELRDQLMTLLLAGHETTATALAWCFDQLLRSPDAYERLRSEIDSDGGGDWMEAVIAETLRVRPVVPMIGRELRKPMTLDGCDLEAGTSVMLSIYLAHTRPDVFEDPYRFDPSRFDGIKPDTYSWIPFGGGTRRCIGAAFAQFEMRTVLRTILTSLDLAPGSGSPDKMVRRNVTLSPKNGSPVLVGSRR